MRQLEVEFAPLAREKGLELDFVPCSLAVRSDRRLLRRLLQNLVSNAIKYTPKGRVLVGCRRRGGKLRIDVYDTGLGIPQSKQRAIFQEFHRLDQGAKVARGLGLGLSIVERIARVLDHKIDLRSSAGPRLALLGRSAAVERALPLDARRRASRRASTAASSPASRCSASTTSRKVLDGMDDAARRLGLPGAQGAGSRDRASPRSTEAQAAPNGLLVDYHLDRGNGLEAIAALRRRFGADLPAILITADRSPRVREEARAHGHPGAATSRSSRRRCAR